MGPGRNNSLTRIRLWHSQPSCLKWKPLFPIILFLLQLRRVSLQLIPLTLVQEIAITGTLPTRLQPGDLRRKENPRLRMKLSGTGSQRITTVVEFCTTACTHVTRHMNMTRGEKTFMRRRLMERRPKLIQALLQPPPKTLMQRNWHWVNHYTQKCALRLVYPQK